MSLNTGFTKNKGLFRILLLCVVAGFTLLWLQFNEPADHIQKAEFEISAIELVAQYLDNETKADSIYSGEVLQLQGKVLSADTATNIIIMEGGENKPAVSCSFSTEKSFDASKIEVGQSIEITGVCSGYLMEVQLIRCRLNQ